MRIGTGFDVHRLVEGRKLILGGVNILHNKGLLGHSDADVLAHAIIDALLGAAALGDIGTHFPDNDEQYKNANSMDLLRQINEKITLAGYRVINIDAVIMAEKPRISPHIQSIRENLCRIIGCSITQISVKATTTEKLGFVGREEGIAVQAVALLENTDSIPGK